MSDDASSKDRAGRIKAKIDASQARSRGEAAPRKAPARTRTRRRDDRSFIDRALDDHPLALLAGSMVLGAIAASLIPASVGRKLASRALGLAAVAGELGSIYGNKALGAAAEGARAGQERLEDLGETLAEHGTDARRKAIELGTLAGKRALELAGVAAGLAANKTREASGSALKAISDATGELSERARP